MTTAITRNEDRVRAALGDALKRDTAELADDTVLADLVAESFALIETVINLQEDLGIRLVQEDLRNVKTVGDLIAVCAPRL